eukprot:6214196-Pleurochrysis_carterae.AAC.4
MSFRPTAVLSEGTYSTVWNGDNSSNEDVGLRCPKAPAISGARRRAHNLMHAQVLVDVVRQAPSAIVPYIP